MSWGPEEFETMNKIVADANKSIEGRVLSEEEIESIVRNSASYSWNDLQECADDLIATIRDRDKTLAELREGIREWIGKEDDFQERGGWERLNELQEQNAILLSALEQIREHERIINAGSARWSLANKAIAKSKGMEESK
jgi:hypothetical protein